MRISANLRIMEIDIDRLAWDRELFTHEPEIQNSHLIVPDRPGWGTEPNEEALRAHPPKTTTGAKADAYGVTGLMVGEIFGPGRSGSTGDFGSVGSTLAPAAWAASPVVAYIAT